MKENTNDLIEKCPCVDCICLPICKNRIIQESKRKRYLPLYIEFNRSMTLLYFSAIDTLIVKCSLFEDYILKGKTSEKLNPNIFVVLKHMELI